MVRLGKDFGPWSPRWPAAGPQVRQSSAHRARPRPDVLPGGCSLRGRCHCRHPLCGQIQSDTTSEWLDAVSRRCSTIASVSPASVQRGRVTRESKSRYQPTANSNQDQRSRRLRELQERSTIARVTELRLRFGLNKHVDGSCPGWRLTPCFRSESAPGLKQTRPASPSDYRMAGGNTVASCHRPRLAGDLGWFGTRLGTVACPLSASRRLHRR